MRAGINKFRRKDSLEGSLFAATQVFTPSPAGRSPQRGRVGEGVGDITCEVKFLFFMFVALTPDLSHYVSYSSFTGTSIARVAREETFQRFFASRLLSNRAKKPVFPDSKIEILSRK